MAAERDVILDFIHSEHDGNQHCTSYILVGTLTNLDDPDPETSDRFITYSDPSQRMSVGIGLLEAASVALKARFIKQAMLDD